MTRKEAVDKLMQEWRATERWRPFFADFVDDYMGEAKTVLKADYEGMRDLLLRQK